MQRCHITTEFVRMKELCESSVCEGLNVWYLSPLHAAGSSQIADKSYPFPDHYSIYWQPPNSQGGISSKTAFPSSLKYKGSRSKHNTSDPGTLNINLNFNHSRENIQAETWNSSKMNYYILMVIYLTLKPFLSLRFGNVQVF